MFFRTTLLAAMALLVSASSQAFTIGNGGLDQGWACVDGSAATCFDRRDFGFGTLIGPATGTITETGVGLVTVDITLNVASALMPAEAGPNGTFGFAGVENILFTNVTYSVTGLLASDIGGGVLTGINTAVGTISGTYELLDGSLASVSGPTAFSDTAVFGALSCVSGTLCGFQVGAIGDFELDVNGTLHDFTHTFNVSIPEPTTAAMVMLGLLGIVRSRH